VTEARDGRDERDTRTRTLWERYYIDTRYHRAVHLLRALREAGSRGGISDVDLLDFAARLEEVLAPGTAGISAAVPKAVDDWLRQHWEDTARHLAERSPSPSGTMSPGEYVRASAIQALADAMHAALEQPSRSTFVSTGHVDWDLIEHPADAATPPEGER
jgi:hypothetical protein